MVRFIILMQWGRVGSNLVVNIINQSGSVKMTNERFNTIRDRDGQVAQYRSHFEIGEEAHAHRLIGTKENVMTLADRDEFAVMLRADGVRIIRMRRDDLLKAAVSQMRAELYAAKTKEELGQAKWAVRRGDTPLGPTAIDPATLVTRMGMMDRARERLMTLFASGEVFDIEYEDILHGLDGVVTGVRAHLDLPADAPFRVPFIKATPDDLASVIVNYDEVAAAVRSSPYGALLPVK